MSEIQRFDIRGEQWGIMHRTDGLGAFCWADDLLWERRQRKMAYVINVIVVLVCAVLAGYLVYHKHDPQPVAKKVPAVTLESTSKLAGLIDRYKNALVEVERVQAKRRTPQHVEVVNSVRWAESHTPVVPTKLHDGQVAQLAREVGFTRIRVME